MWTARNQIETKWSYLWAYDMGWFKAKANPAVPADTKIIPPYPHPTLNLNKLENEEPTTQFIQ